MSGLLTEKKNWGRWGDDDERGAANLVTPEKVLEALRLPKTGEVISLAVPISRTTTPFRGNRNPPLHFLSRDGGDYAAGRKSRGITKSADDYIVMGCHSGTHIDALAHVWYGEHIYNGFSEGTIRSDGARRCGIDKVGPIVTRGVLLDFCKYKNVPVLPESYKISPDDVEGILAKQGVAVTPGDCVLIHTGWIEVYGADREKYGRPEPGLGLAAAVALADKGAAFFAADNYAVEVAPPDPDGEGLGTPIHGELLRNRGIYILEALRLCELASRRRYEFMISFAALPIVGGIGSPVVPVAVL